MSNHELIFCKACKVYFEMSFEIGLTCPYCRKKDHNRKRKLREAGNEAKTYLQHFDKKKKEQQPL